MVVVMLVYKLSLLAKIQHFSLDMWKKCHFEGAIVSGEANTLGKL